MLPELSTLSVLPPPYDLLELQQGQSITFTAVGYSLGSMPIVPKGQTAGKTIYALRVHVEPADKPTVPRYWDVSAGLLIVELWSQLEAAGGRRRRFKITKLGYGVRSRFTLEVLPLT
jgi:uncharacterized RDD family membrane protein YckC